ncbi:MAG: hypothetical protein OHK0053_15630 [Microscillaceae bacterium]
MKTRYEDIEPFLMDFLKGQVEESMEYRIRAYLQENPDFQEELDELQATLDYMHQLPKLSPEPSLKMNFYAMLREAQSAPPPPARFSWAGWFQPLWGQRLALGGALALIFLAGYATSLWLNPWKNPQENLSQHEAPETTPENIASPGPAREEKRALEEAEQEIATNEAQAESLSSAPALAYTPTPEAEPLSENQSNIGLSNHVLPAPPAPNASFQTQSSKMMLPPVRQEESPREFVADVPQTLVTEAPPSDERLGAVYSPASQYESEAQVLAALLAVLQTDPSPNVRIAAIDALENFIHRPEVRQQLCESLLGQDSPTTQMATIDVLVKYQIREGVRVLRRFLAQDNLHVTVRKQAQLALEILS